MQLLPSARVCSLCVCARAVRARMQLLPSAHVCSLCVGARPVRARTQLLPSARVRSLCVCALLRGRQTQLVPSACVRSLCVHVRPVRARVQILPSARVRNQRAGEGAAGRQQLEKEEGGKQPHSWLLSVRLTSNRPEPEPAPLSWWPKGREQSARSAEDGTHHFNEVPRGHGRREKDNQGR
jgi:hypothetical protein